MQLERSLVRIRVCALIFSFLLAVEPQRNAYSFCSSQRRRGRIHRADRQPGGTVLECSPRCSMRLMWLLLDEFLPALPPARGRPLIVDDCMHSTMMMLSPAVHGIWNLLYFLITFVYVRTTTCTPCLLYLQTSVCSSIYCR